MKLLLDQFVSEQVFQELKFGQVVVKTLVWIWNRCIYSESHRKIGCFKPQFPSSQPNFYWFNSLSCYYVLRSLVHDTLNWDLARAWQRVEGRGRQECCGGIAGNAQPLRVSGKSRQMAKTESGTARLRGLTGIGTNLNNLENSCNWTCYIFSEGAERQSTGRVISCIKTDNSPPFMYHFRCYILIFFSEISLCLHCWWPIDWKDEETKRKTKEIFHL